MAERKHRNALEPGYELHWYTIQDVLGQGGFGITYLAYDANLKQNVAIKEYLPSGIAMRETDNTVHPITEDKRTDFDWGLERFLTEARTLTRFDHSNIVRVIAVFELNKTAYMVMRYEHGKGLDAFLPNNETLEERWLKKMLFPIIGGLSQVHTAGFIHRDIKPPNIFIREDNSPVLIDFGSARQALGQETHTLTAMISPGYAPFEQYHAKSDQQGPWTDIYGLGATLYRGVTGQSPADALKRGETLLGEDKDPYISATELAGEGYSRSFLEAIDQALAFREKDRPQTLKLWLECIHRQSNHTRPTANIKKPIETDRGATTEVSLTLVPDEEIEAQIAETNPLKDSKKEPAKKRFRLFGKKTFFILLLAFLLLILLSALSKRGQTPQPISGANQNEGLGNFNSADTNTGDLVGDYQERLSNNPNDTEAQSALDTLVDYHMALGQRALANGNNARARQHFRRALAAAPNQERRKELRESLQRLRQN